MYKKTFTFTFTLTEFHAFFVGVLVLHFAFMNSRLKYNLAPGSIMKVTETKEHSIEGEKKIAVRLGSRLTKSSRVSRFNRYIKKVKGVQTTEEVIDKSLFQGELSEAEERELSKLSQTEIDKLVDLQQKNYREDAKGVRKILERNQATFQGCYEKALLKDQLLNGVGKLVIFIQKGSVINVESLFKGDGHKSAISSLTKCLDVKSKSLRVSKIKGNHKVKFNLVFKS